MTTLTPIESDACQNSAHTSYSASDYEWQALCNDPVASQIPLLPPFTEATARAKVQRAENLWNTRNPHKVALAYTSDSIWRNRDEFVQGREGIVALLTRKWEKELNYKLKKELFLFSDHKIAVQFAYEWNDAEGNRFRSHGIEHWEFAPDGLMEKRTASINDVHLDERV
jgi:uncharacterized protein